MKCTELNELSEVERPCKKPPMGASIHPIQITPSPSP